MKCAGSSDLHQVHQRAATALSQELVLMLAKGCNPDIKLSSISVDGLQSQGRGLLPRITLPSTRVLYCYLIQNGVKFASTKPKEGFMKVAIFYVPFEMRKMWDCRTVVAEIREAFKDRIPEDVRYPFTRRARANQLSASQQGSSGTMTRPNQPSASQQGSSGTMTRANQPSASQQGSSGTMTRANQPSASQQGSSGTMTRANQPCASPQGSSGTMTRANQHVENVATVNQIQSDNNDDYATYLSIMGSISDLSSDGEELSQAIMASLESHV
ncbi:uncharacterized protein LOC114555695 isoform X1 [Perca flavescens]|uniref:uncharacterized protein LOC114555695 isoform X1 n=1 Tax=Perca flavescens TaxID=8167 RepID=UPI00106DE62F|nr:uncharacterized protein LOC114555695 isoform X1 [Perca flavescens]